MIYNRVMLRSTIIFFFALALSLYFASPTFAFMPKHVTVIINQVRGPECCDAGTIDRIQQQVDALKRNDLPATFAVRYDAITDKSFSDYLKNLQALHYEIGGFLEVTPNLARAAHVKYSGDVSRWYEAQQAYLIGYQPSDRKRLIDTYMDAFHVTFGTYPDTTVAWMIDPVSLQYLQDTYQVKMHEITREQWGTDSYTLYGGSPEYPYIPSKNWALIPDPGAKMPMVVRQTITDPISGYGDQTSGFTSQPNDYMNRGADISYFSWLLQQSHNQPTEPFTFDVIGLENSMDAKYQDEFGRQLDTVKQWIQKDAADNTAMQGSQAVVWWTHIGHPAVSVYQGAGDQNSHAWWMSTSKYRVRIRQDNGTVYMTDIRIYDPAFTDPYTSLTAVRAGYWDVPFLLDGSRFMKDDVSTDAVGSFTDNLSNRDARLKSPTRIELGSKLSTITALRIGDCISLRTTTAELASFCPNTFTLPSAAKTFLNNGTISPAVNAAATAITWQTKEHQDFIGATITKNPEGTSTYAPFSHPEFLENERKERYNILFPVLLHASPDAKKTSISVGNSYAIAGKNPVHLVLFPRDQYGNAVILNQPPTVTTPDSNIKMTIGDQFRENGMVFIDFASDQSKSVPIKVNVGEYQFVGVAHFAPDCRQEFMRCITHPIEAWWYLRASIDEWIGRLKHALSQSEV